MAATADAVLAELRERVSAAHRTRQALRLKGSGTKDFYGESLAGEVLELRAHQGIVDYEPSELVITARCGTPLSQIEAALAAHGQFLAFEPPAFGADPTLGGVIAAGLSGPRRVYAGAAPGIPCGGGSPRATTRREPAPRGGGRGACRARLQPPAVRLTLSL